MKASLYVNGAKLSGKCIAWDGYEKIYVCKTYEEIEAFAGYGYELYTVDSLEAIYRASNGTRFISYADLNKGEIVPQFEAATFEGFPRKAGALNIQLY